MCTVLLWITCQGVAPETSWCGVGPHCGAYPSWQWYLFDWAVCDCIAAYVDGTARLSLGPASVGGWGFYSPPVLGAWLLYSLWYDGVCELFFAAQIEGASEREPPCRWHGGWYQVRVRGRFDVCKHTDPSKVMAMALLACCSTSWRVGRQRMCQVSLSFFQVLFFPGSE